MIEIKKVTDPAIAEKICEEAHITPNEKYHIIATVEQGNIVNSAVFQYDHDEGRILHISGFNGDILMLDGLCRAILNMMDIQGVKVVYLSSKYEKLAKYVGFHRNQDQFELQLEGFFQCGCCRKKGNE